jgi:hypothetical protein
LLKDCDIMKKISVKSIPKYKGNYLYFEGDNKSCPCIVKYKDDSEDGYVCGDYYIYRFPKWTLVHNGFIRGYETENIYVLDNHEEVVALML